MRFRVGGRRVVAGPGDTVRVPPGTVHHFANAAGQPARVAVRTSPALSMQELLETAATMAREQYAAGRRLPRPLDLALFMHDFEREVRAPYLPAALVGAVIRPLAWLARRRGAGRDLATDQATARRELGIVFQQPSLDLNLTAEENIRLHAVLYGLYPWRPMYRLMPAGYRRQVQEMAGVLDLSDILGQRARALSGGLRRRLEIIRSLMHRPAVLFLDEPTAGLDPESRRSLWAYLRHARAAFGTTVFLTTHYLEEAEAADAVCVLARGRIIERGSPAEVKTRQRSATLEEAYLRLLGPARSDARPAAGS